MRTIAIANQKGGTGKTTTAVNLAAALGELNQRCLLIDLDPQGCATRSVGLEDDGQQLLQLLCENGQSELTLQSLVRPTGAAGVDAVPGGMWLSNAERMMLGEVGAETVLRHHIEALLPRWDFLLVDCPPSLGMLSVSGLVAVDEVFVAIQPNYVSLQGLVQLLRTVERIKIRLNSRLAVTGVVACQVDRRTKLARHVNARLMETFGDAVFQTTIRRNVRLAEAPSFGKPITQYAPASAGAVDYRALAREVLAQNGDKR